MRYLSMARRGAHKGTKSQRPNSKHEDTSNAGVLHGGEDEEQSNQSFFPPLFPK